MPTLQKIDRVLHALVCRFFLKINVGWAMPTFVNEIEGQSTSKYLWAMPTLRF